MKNRFFIPATLLALLTVSPALSEGEDYPRHRDAHLQELRAKTDCLQKTSDWEGWERCQNQAERREKERRLEEPKEEQELLEEELRQMR